jgi:hypothetical protein
MDLFRQVGAQIDRTWERFDYDERSFPRLAADALAGARLHEKLGPDDVLRWLLASPVLPEQHDLDASFAEPPVTVYQGRRFYIQVLFWMSKSTTVHRHGFSGAFQVLHGERLQTRHAFHLRRRINAQFLLGYVRHAGAELLARGEVAEIHRDLIHSIVHIDAPSATIVVRTDYEAEAGPQYDYRWPFLAFDPFHVDPGRVRKLQGLSLLLRSGHRDYAALAAERIAASDLHTGFLVLEQAYQGLGEPELEKTPIAEAARRRFGVIFPALLAVFHEDRRRNAIHNLRQRELDESQRVLLALLYIPDKNGLFELIRRRFPGEDPGERLVAFASSLSGTDRIGIDLSDDLNRCLLPALLAGRSQRQILRALKREFDAATVDAQAGAVAAHCERLRDTVFGPLLGPRQDRGGRLGATP